MPGSLILIENHCTQKKVWDIIEHIILLKLYWETWTLFYNRCKLLWQKCTLIFYWWLLLLWLDLFYGQLDSNCFSEISENFMHQSAGHKGIKTINRSEAIRGYHFPFLKEINYHLHSFSWGERLELNIWFFWY